MNIYSPVPRNPFPSCVHQSTIKIFLSHVQSWRAIFHTHKKTPSNVWPNTNKYYILYFTIWILPCRCFSVINKHVIASENISTKQFIVRTHGLHADLKCNREMLHLASNEEGICFRSIFINVSFKKKRKKTVPKERKNQNFYSQIWVYCTNPKGPSKRHNNKKKGKKHRRWKEKHPTEKKKYKKSLKFFSTAHFRVIDFVPMIAHEI